MAGGTALALAPTISEPASQLAASPAAKQIAPIISNVRSRDLTDGRL
jgi:hypothetical protein